MTWIVKLYIGGKVFEEEVIAANMADARRAALSRNPSAKVMGATVKFK